ncbi:threonine aldolase family protein [Phaeobacter inhibens]|uniref:threonine aldolase family protein n=1 Tax=Phaeobacter inhibens TaxID=221822 RepID=UPI0021A6446C|nr:threonine aldolase family protein [Phaeobacter inhibens]UWR55552.1 threonine aldolase family protein [Phaeobacter inhibens]
MTNFYTEAYAEPTKEMREAGTYAPVGNSLIGEDPSTKALLERAADFLGKEAALFMSSGTMCNEVAVRAHTRPGQEVICEKSCHIINFECGGPAAISGAMIHSIDGDRGMFTADQLSEAIRSGNPYLPQTGLVTVEQTANMAGGAIWPLEQLRKVANTAKQANIPTHMDGARLINAVVASGHPASEMTKGYDSVYMDFCKALNCPVGAVLAGSKEFIQEAWRIRQMIGGGIRRTGMLAAMANYALDHHVDRINEDHQLAQYIGERVGNIKGVASVEPVETNIVIIDFDPAGPAAPEIVAKLKESNVLVGAFGKYRIRVVTFMGRTLKDGEILCSELDKVLNG